MNKYQEALDHILYCDRDKPHSYISDAYRNDFSTLQKLIDKATPKKPKIEKHPYSIDYESSLVDKYFCPNCNQFLREVAGYHFNKNYCDKCGQAISWSESEEE